MGLSKRIKNLAGQTKGRWAILSFSGNNELGRAMWNCRCACGTERRVLGSALNNGYSQSCGCLQREISSKTPKSNALPSGQALRNRMLYVYRRNARQAGVAWNLTETEFDVLIKASCFYCGTDPTAHTPRFHKIGRKWAGFNGIDRKDSSRGYITDNVVSCCSVCNFMKGIMSVEAFLDHVAAIYRNSSQAAAHGAK